MTTTAGQDPLRCLSDELDTLVAQGLNRRRRILDEEPRAHTRFNGRSVVNRSSNNYLGLTTHLRLRLREKALEAVRQFGVGAGSVRTIAGTMPIHMEPERRLARLYQEGVLAHGIAFRIVARDKARVRTIVTATHTREDLQFALDVFKRVGGELGII